MTKSKSTWKSLSFVGLGQVVASFTIILSILTLFDKHHWLIELFTHFKLQYLLASVVCSIILALYKNHRFSIVLLFVAVLNAFYVLPWYFSYPENTSENNNTDLTIIHSNVYRDNNDFEGFIELINQESPDLFVMQEVNDKWLSEVNELESVYPHMFKTPRNDNFGIALFSKHPFESVKKIKWNTSNVPSIVATIGINEQFVTVIATHPLPPVNIDYYKSRNSQINNLAELARNHQGPLVIIGDLNITTWSYDYKPLELGTNLRNAKKGFGSLPTWPAQFLLPIFMIPIDHCLVSSHFVVNDIRVGNNIGSDHLPLIVKLGLKRIETQGDLITSNLIN